MTEHAVLIIGGGPTGLMLAAELTLAGIDAAVVERRPSQDLPGSRAGGLHARTIEVLARAGQAPSGPGPRCRGSSPSMCSGHAGGSCGCAVEWALDRRTRCLPQ